MKQFKRHSAAGLALLCLSLLHEVVLHLALGAVICPLTGRLPLGVTEKNEAALISFHYTRVTAFQSPLGLGAPHYCQHPTGATALETEATVSNNRCRALSSFQANREEAYPAARTLQRPALSVRSLSAVCRHDETVACSFPRGQHAQQLPNRNHLLCGLPRGVRGSTFLLPTHAAFENSKDSSSQGPRRKVSAGEGLTCDVFPGDDGVSTQGKSGPNCKIPEHSSNVDQKSAASAAAGRLLERARMVQSAASGIFCTLPLGFRVMKKIEAICHEELDAVGAAPLSLPNLMPFEWLHKSKRERSFGASLYRLRDRRARELFLPPTCEEAAAWLTSTGLRSHKELPLMFYQIGSKFRDEPRPRAGCLRAREFFMLEAYSFHQNESCRERTYHMMDECFRRIFARVGVAPIYRVLADSGAMGGPCSHEYHVQSVLGEDHSLPTLSVPQGPSSSYVRVSGDKASDCPPICRSLEIGHCFQLPGTYCEAVGVQFTDPWGTLKVPLMNSYGVGVSRLVGHLALSHQDEKGLSFPPQVAPFCVAVLPQNAARWSSDRRVERVGMALFERLKKIAAEVGGSADVLLDDRQGPTLRQMQAHADLVGIPYQVIIKAEFLHPPGPPRVLYIARSSGKMKVLPIRNALETLKGALSRASMTNNLDVSST